MTTPDGPDGPGARALAHVATRSSRSPMPADLRVTVHFHPDRVGPQGMTVIEQLVTDGVYRSQFETGTSNGGLTAHPGGDRWRWEERIFAGAYDDASPAERPVYGSLNHRRRSEGGSIRFGSAHLRLTAAATARCTFCYPDSVFEPTAFGTSARMSLIALADGDHRDRLDDYIEAQLHGGLVIARDVEAVVLDPSFRGTTVATWAAALPVPTSWHQGFRLSLAELDRHPDYRGPGIAAIGRSVAHDGIVDAMIIGQAARDQVHDPQSIKRLWHCVARFGTPSEPPAGPGT